MDFEQQQEVTKILEDYRNNPSNSNKYRFELFAYIDKALEQAEQAARVDELERLGGYRPNGIADDQMLMGIDINERLAQLTESKSSHE